MNKIIKTLVATSLITNVNCVVMANPEVADYSALTGEYVASNPGLEIAVPRWKRVDNDGSGKVDGYDFYFDVFKSGTQTKLFSTPIKYLAFNPACADSSIPEAKYIVFKRIGNNIAMSAKFEYIDTCAASKAESAGQIYVVDISTRGKTPWVKSFSGELIATGILPDTNGNGVGELSVTIETGTNYTNDNSDNSFYVYDGQTGVSLATQQKYAIER